METESALQIDHHSPHNINSRISYQGLSHGWAAHHIAICRSISTLSGEVQAEVTRFDFTNEEAS